MNVGRFRLSLYAMAALTWVLIVQVSSPSDLWDQTQPRTVSYTTDIIVHGQSHWILPIERGELPATKPPLYNWLAVPMVKLLGFNSEIGHKFPSIVALCMCWLLLILLGRRLDVLPDQSVGWLAGIIVVTNYTMFKLGYLARPDMLLTLWLFIAWMIATHVMVEQRTESCVPSSRQHAGGYMELGTRNAQTRNAALGVRRMLAAGFWMCVTLAALTKGPAALVAVAYAIVAARIIGSSWRSIAALYPLTGLTATLLITGAWVYGVWQIDPQHVSQVLWHDEIYGRITGTGPEGNHNGLQGWINTFPNCTIYFFVRFIPWSIVSILAIVALWRRIKYDDRTQVRRWQTIGGEAGPWLCGAAIQVVLVIGLFTLSTGKRADYIAAAFPPGALLAAWWLLRMRPFVAVRSPWLAPAAAVIILTAISVYSFEQPIAMTPMQGIHTKQFIDQVTDRVADDPLPLTFFQTGPLHLQAMLGASMKDDRDALLELVDGGQPFWAIASKPRADMEFDQWLKRQRNRIRLSVQPVLHSKPLPWKAKEPEPLTLYRVQRRTGVPVRRPTGITTADSSHEHQGSDKTKDR